MVTANLLQLSTGLDRLMAELDGQLAGTAGCPEGAPASLVDRTGSRPRTDSPWAENVVAQLERATERGAELIATIRSFRTGGPVPPLDLAAESVLSPQQQLPLAIAPLSVPDRILKRNYNYFDSLNASLQLLAEKQRSG